MHFAELQKTRLPHSTTLRRIPTDPAHAPTGCVLQVVANSPGINHGATLNMPYQPRQNGMYLVSDVGSNKPDIEKLLDDMHARYPAFCYPQYEEQLRNHGVHSLIDAATFDIDYYIARVGMAEGAAWLFCQCVARAFRKAQLAEEEQKMADSEVGADQEKENAVP
jgi:hypothetical protein